MKILNANAGALANSEVDFLRSKGCCGDSTRLVTNTAPSELKVYDNLVESPPCNQTREVINDFLEKCRPFNRAKAEVLNIINTRPSDLVYIYPIVGLCDDRLGDSIEELKQIILRGVASSSSNEWPRRLKKKGLRWAKNDQHNEEDKDETAQGNQVEFKLRLLNKKQLGLYFVLRIREQKDVQMITLRISKSVNELIYQNFQLQFCPNIQWLRSLDIPLSWPLKEDIFAFKFIYLL